MNKHQLTGIYQDYITCLNQQDWQTLGQFVHPKVSHNGNLIGLEGYRQMLEKDFAEIPDLYFNIDILVADPPRVASRLRFNCTPRGRFLDIAVNGLTVSFTENVFYEFVDQKIIRVWSIIDKAAIEAQMLTRHPDMNA